ncbi:MAG: hypothetical protein P1U58_18045 [Verrucomicrobiales bacterium]|nr:hypothetical protein [Verrucomicrobiales bacterium]
MIRNALTLIGLLGAIASIIAVVAMGSDEIAKTKSLLFSIEVSILVSMLGIGFVVASVMFAILPRYKKRQSPNGREISWIQFFRLASPKTNRETITRLLEFQSLMVQLGPSRKNYSCITDKRYKKEVFDQFFKHIKRTIDSYTGADVSVQIKLFPIDVLRRSALEGFSGVARNIDNETLEHYYHKESAANSSEPRRTGNYRVRSTSGAASDLRALVDTSKIKKKVSGTEERECSALNQSVSINRPYWIGNDVAGDVYPSEFFSNSPHQQSHYRSIAVFAITRYMENVPEDGVNPPWGFLIIQSKEVDRFDSVLLPSIGTYYANRLFFFLYHTFDQIAKHQQNHQVEQDGTGQPATRSESKPEGSDKPQAESEGRSR